VHRLVVNVDECGLFELDCPDHLERCEFWVSIHGDEKVKSFIGLAALAGVALTAGLYIWRPAWLSSWSPATFGSTGPTVTQLETLRHLVTTRIHIADVLDAASHGYRGSWLVKGDALYVVDLGKAEIPIDGKDDVNRTARIRLGLPSVMSPRVDHEKTRAWKVERTRWIPIGGDEDLMRDDAMRHAQELIVHAARGAEYMDQAKVHAETAIKAFYKLVEWDVSIEWKPN
jgi:hypothetical protein